MVIDTTVFVDLSNNIKEAHDFVIKSKESLYTSRIVLMELIKGLRKKTDIKKVKNMLGKLGVDTIEINPKISEKAGSLFEAYSHSHGIGIMDAMIAATALVINEKLVTHNLKHFRYIKELDIVVPY